MVLDVFTWVVVAVLTFGLTLERTKLHLIGLSGMAYFTWWSYAHQDWPQMVLNGSAGVVHVFMFFKFWKASRLNVDTLC